MSAAGLVLAVEAGGTKSDAVLATPLGEELARTRGGPGNLQTSGCEGAAELLRGLAAETASAAGRAPGEIRTVSLAMAGVDCASDEARVRRAVKAAGLAGRVAVCNDARAALLGACGDQGVLLIAGTGSIAFGRNLDGRERRAGGWGHDFGDEGSAYDLGRRALTLTTRVADGRARPCLLAERVCQALGIASLSELRAAVVPLFSNVRAIAGLAPLVIEASRDGDPEAHAIVDAGVRRLAQMAGAVSQELGLDGSGFPIALYGGLLSNSPHYSERLLEMLQVRFPRCELLLAPADAGLRGALAIGLRTAAPRGRDRG